MNLKNWDVKMGLSDEAWKGLTPEERRELRRPKNKKQREQYFVLRDIVNKIDPMALICMGAPPHEYESELAQFLDNWNPDFKRKDCKDLIVTIFQKAFTPSSLGVMVNYSKLATAWHMALK